MKAIKYKGHIIELHLSGFFSTSSVNGILKADTLTGIKKLINQI